MSNRKIVRYGLFVFTILSLGGICQGKQATPTGWSYAYVYYGHLHNHSNLSDGSGTPDLAYTTAQANGLDFFSLADHGEQLTSTEYGLIKSTAESRNVPGTFTTFWGFEWSHSTQGHVAVFNSPDYCGSGNPTTFTGLCNWLSSRDCIAFFNHPGRQNSTGIEFDHFTGTHSDKIVGMELWNKGDLFSMYYYNNGYTSDGRTRSGYFDEAQLNGWRIGAQGSEDNHSGTWGLSNNRLAILANANTRADLYAAMQARRFYSTLDKNLMLSLEIDGKPMGSQVVGGSNVCIVKAADADNEIFTKVELIINGYVADTQYPNLARPEITWNLNSTLPGDYIYCKVTQTDGNEAISSPVFVIQTSNRQPIANSQTVQTDEDAAVAITLTGSDPDNDPLTFAPGIQPAHGVLSGTAPALTYTPVANFNGTDTFTFTVNDGQLTSTPATVTITITPVNDAPTAIADAYSMAQDTVLSVAAPGVLANDTDVDLNSLTATVVNGPASGSLTLNSNGSFTYTPNANFIGNDSFTYKANDGLADSMPAAVTITISPINHRPVANGQVVATDEDAAVAVTLTGSDPDNDPLTFALGIQPAHGALSGTAPALTYTPAANFNGADSFTFTVSDGQLISASATVTITINPVNDAPLAINDIAYTAANTAVTIAVLANDSDIEQDLLTVTQLTQPSGTATLNTTDWTVTYTPQAGFTGTDSFTYTAFDGVSTSNVATVTIHVTTVNYDAYVAAEPTVTLGTVSGTISATTLRDGLVQKIVEVSSGPAGSSLGVEYVLHTQADPAAITQPVTLNLAHTWTGGTTDPLMIELFVAGTWTDITADISDGQYQATNPGSIIDAQGDIRIRFSDTIKARKEAKDTLVIDLLYAHIVVGPLNVTATDDSYIAAVNSMLTVAAPGVLANDTDADPLDSLAASVAVNPSHGTLTLSADGSFTYTPVSDFTGIDSFTYTASDGKGGATPPP